MNEHDYEPIPGLPERLPAGEQIVWQGAPQWQALARRAFHIRKLAIYFLLLLVWFGMSLLSDGHTAAAAVIATLWLVLLAAGAIGTMALVAWLIARTTLYTITTRRVVIRFGVALPMTVNIPFRIVRSAALKAYDDGTGDICLALSGSGRVAYLVLWPHARPWRIARVEPSLRVVADAPAVAEILAQALVASAAMPVRQARTIAETGVHERPRATAVA